MTLITEQTSMGDEISDMSSVMTVPAAVGEQNSGPAPLPTYGACTIAITSGKGGVGKSNLAVNMALELAALGHRTSLLDADLALANADVLFGVNPKLHLGNVLSGTCTLEEIIIDVADELRLIPGGSGVEELANLTSDDHAQLVSELRAMEADSDFMIVDTAAGIGANVTGVLRAASEVIIVTTPDPTALVDAYATIKVLFQRSPTKPIFVVVNDVVGIGDAEQIFAQLRATTERFLNRTLEHLGTIPRDPQLAEAVREQVPVVEYSPDCPASRAIRLIARHLNQKHRVKSSADRTFDSFWSSLTEQHG
jgi:flagellar biosynthesis protein FlhG